MSDLMYSIEVINPNVSKLRIFLWFFDRKSPVFSLKIQLLTITTHGQVGEDVCFHIKLYAHMAHYLGSIKFWWPWPNYQGHEPLFCNWACLHHIRTTIHVVAIISWHIILKQNIFDASKFWWPWNDLKVTGSDFAVWLVCIIGTRIYMWSLSYLGIWFHRDVFWTYQILVTLKWPQGHKQPFCNLASQHFGWDMHVIALKTLQYDSLAIFFEHLKILVTFKLPQGHWQPVCSSACLHHLKSDIYVITIIS